MRNPVSADTTVGTQQKLPHNRTLRGHPVHRSRLFSSNVLVLYLFLVPALVATLLFSYLPMFSNYIAFLDYNFNKGWFGLGSRFVGFANFAKFLTDPKFYALMQRTLVYSVTMMALTFPLPLVIALMFNELRGAIFKRTIQTISYVPHFVSWVTVSGLVYLFLSSDRSGLVNNLIQFFNPNAQRVSFMGYAKNFLPLMVITEIWKEAGWGTILYLAALATIEPQLYEAARVDGAGRFRCLWHVTLPGLMPTMSILLIFALGGLFGTNFDQVFNMQNRAIRMDTNTIGVYVYYQGMESGNYAYSAAVGLFQGLISFILIMSTNAVTKRLNNVGII